MEQEAQTPLSPDLAHEGSGELCQLPNHNDGHGPCQRCRWCKVKIRPQHMGDPCPARA